jgi:hypothetical protein
MTTLTSHLRIRIADELDAATVGRRGAVLDAAAADPTEIVAVDRGHGAGLVAPHTVMTTLACARPSLRYRMASGTSLNENVLSTTGVARGETRRARAARRRIERCADGDEQVRKALFELVDQVVDEPAYT